MINQRVFVSWLPVAIATTIILGTVYAVVQQNYRQSANDPQIQLVEDSAAALSQGLPPEQLASGASNVDITKSLAAFVMIFDDKGKTLVSSAVLGSSSPTLPVGVLDSTRNLNVNKITWQIPSGQRFAAVIKHWNSTNGTSGFELVARSLREIEEREFQLEMIIAAAWIVAMVATLIAEWLKFLYHKKYILSHN